MKIQILKCSLVYVLLATMVACGSKGESDELFPGRTQFVNEEPEGSGNNFRGGKEIDGLATGAPANASDSGAKGAPGAPMGRVGPVEEGDIYRIANNHLFYLSTYRGLVIYDVTDPKAPGRVSRLPVFGYPVEMFVEGNTVYALLRDALYLSQNQGGMKFERHNVSQLVSIDITDINNPKVLKTVDIKGELREGVTRKIANTIYVVSYLSSSYWWGWNVGNASAKQTEQAWVYSFNVADPANLELVQELKVFEGGGISFSDPKTGVSLWRNFESVAISATSNALMVVENWHISSSVSDVGFQGGRGGCGSYNSDQQALVSLIDISDPSGRIRLHSRFETTGHIGDQFKMTYAFDERAKTATFYGIFARRAWSGSNCTGGSLIQNKIESWDVTQGETPIKLSSLDFGKPDETVRGSAFDIDRQVAYAITARQIDPLYVIGLNDPKNLKILSEIDGLSGDMNVFRLVAEKGFLLGIGNDASQACEGFQEPGELGAPNKIAVSMIDVRNLNAIRLAQRRCVAVENASWVGSDVNLNLDQAHKLIGMHSDGQVNLITVPVYYSKKSTEDNWWWYRLETAVGIMSWDASKFNPSKPPAEQTVIKSFGTVVHPHGQVRRSIVFTHKGTSDRRMMINLSDTHIGITDIEDLANPVPQAQVELAPFHSEIFKFGNYLVEHIQEDPYGGWGGDQGSSEFRVKLAGGELESTPTVASFRLGQINRVVKHGNNLVLFRSFYTPNPKNGVYVPPVHEAFVVDFADPLHPRAAGSLTLPQNVQPEYRFWCGGGGYWGGYWFDQTNNWLATADALVFFNTEWDSGKPRPILSVLSLAVPGQPTLQQRALDGVVWDGMFGLVADPMDPSGFFLAYRKAGAKTLRGETTFVAYRYFAQRWNVSRGALVDGESVNLPGRLVRTWANSQGQRLYLTQDNLFREITYPNETGGNHSYWDPDYRLNLLRATKAGVAELLDSHHLVDLSLRDLIPDGDKLYVNGGPSYDGYGYAVSDAGRGALPPSEARDRSDRFLVFDLSKLKLAKVYDQHTGTHNIQLMGTYQRKLFMNVPGDGILVVDVSNPVAPRGVQFMRTLGYASHIEFVGDKAYVAAGHFGVYHLDLSAPSAFASE